MTKMIRPLFLCIVLTLSFSVSCLQQQSKADSMLPVEAVAIPGKKGWGYEIYVDKKLYIKQDCIPAVTGIHQFATKDQALTTANLVLAKMKEGKKPFLTVQELQQAGINIYK